MLELGWFVSQFAMPFYKVANQFSWFANSQYENNFLKAWIICPLSSIFLVTHHVTFMCLCIKFYGSYTAYLRCTCRPTKMHTALTVWLQMECDSLYNISLPPVCGYTKVTYSDSVVGSCELAY